MNISSGVGLRSLEVAQGGNGRRGGGGAAPFPLSRGTLYVTDNSTPSRCLFRWSVACFSSAASSSRFFLSARKLRTAKEQGIYSRD